MKRTLLLAILALLWNSTAYSQDVYERNEFADVRHYVFSLELNDSNNRITGEALVTVDFKDEVENFSLDLIKKSGEFGMELIGMSEGERPISYEYENNKIIVPAKSGIKTYKVQYQGIPERGLVIDTTKFGQRSFFGDNWPNLARHWLPCVDHPYDKASLEFKITAPDKYDVVATGKKVEESSLGNGYKITHYHEPAPVAMKVVTIGVTQFATKLLGKVNDIPVTAWVYPENRLDGFSDYAVAVNVLEYFVKNIGPYPFAKLANMQAKTQWGGLENAGTIAYFENSVSGKNEVEGLIAHEIAHQWFGNSATENSWNHVWLSEGFATYFTILYQEDVYGNNKRKEELILDRRQVIEYYKRNPSAVVDNSIKNPMRVLSTNTYQKGSWVLNMLRRKLGDEIFWKGIRQYYEAFRDSNVMTGDFRVVMEKVSGEDLESFFQQWIYTKGYPEIQWNWEYQNKKIIVSLEQKQEHFAFGFPLEVGITANGKTTIETLRVDNNRHTFEIVSDTKPEEVILDPDVWLLFEEK